MTRNLLTGKTGQVGYELERSLQGLGEIIAFDRSQMDLANLAQVRDVISIKPDLIINPRRLHRSSQGRKRAGAGDAH